MDTTTAQIVIAAFIPLIISALKKTAHPAVVNAIIAILIYVAAGIVSVVTSGESFDLTNIVPAVAIFTTGGTVAYQLFWKNWGDPQITAKVRG